MKHLITKQNTIIYFSMLQKGMHLPLSNSLISLYINALQERTSTMYQSLYSVFYCIICIFVAVAFFCIFILFHNILIKLFHIFFFIKTLMQFDIHKYAAVIIHMHLLEKKCQYFLIQFDFFCSATPQKKQVSMIRKYYNHN